MMKTKSESLSIQRAKPMIEQKNKNYYYYYYNYILNYL